MPNVTECKFFDPSKAPTPIVKTESGMLIFCTLPALENALSSMDFIFEPLAKEMVFSRFEPEKALSPIELTLAGIV